MSAGRHRTRRSQTPPPRAASSSSSRSAGATLRLLGAAKSAPGRRRRCAYHRQSCTSRQRNLHCLQASGQVVPGRALAGLRLMRRRAVGALRAARLRRTRHEARSQRWRPQHATLPSPPAVLTTSGHAAGQCTGACARAGARLQAAVVGRGHLAEELHPPVGWQDGGAIARQPAPHADLQAAGGRGGRGGSARHQRTWPLVGGGVRAVTAGPARLAASRLPLVEGQHCPHRHRVVEVGSVDPTACGSQGGRAAARASRGRWRQRAGSGPAGAAAAGCTSQPAGRRPVRPSTPPREASSSRTAGQPRVHLPGARASGAPVTAQRSLATHSPWEDGKSVRTSTVPAARQQQHAGRRVSPAGVSACTGLWAGSGSAAGAGARRAAGAGPSRAKRARVAPHRQSRPALHSQSKR